MPAYLSRTCDTIYVFEKLLSFINFSVDSLGLKPVENIFLILSCLFELICMLDLELLAEWSFSSFVTSSTCASLSVASMICASVLDRLLSSAAILILLFWVVSETGVCRTLVFLSLLLCKLSYTGFGGEAIQYIHF